jgi:hypothetical protein
VRQLRKLVLRETKILPECVTKRQKFLKGSRYKNFCHIRFNPVAESWCSECNFFNVAQRLAFGLVDNLAANFGLAVGHFSASPNREIAAVENVLHETPFYDGRLPRNFVTKDYKQWGVNMLRNHLKHKFSEISI